MRRRETTTSAYSNRVFTVSLWLIAILIAATMLFHSPWFQLEHIVIDGARQLTRDDILRTTGFRIGESLFSIDLLSGEQYLRALPIVSDVALRRQLPGTLRVTVRERRPVAWLQGSRGFWAVDVHGMPLFFTPDLSVPLPVITLNPPVTAEAGVPLGQARLLESLIFADALSATGLAFISEIHADGENLFAYTRDGITVSLGRGGDMSDKARVLESILKDVEKGRMSIGYIDLRHPHSPTLRRPR